MQRIVKRNAIFSNMEMERLETLLCTQAATNWKGGNTMRKVGLILGTVVLGIMLATPVYAFGGYAAVPHRRHSYYRWHWGWWNQPVLTQPAIPSLPQRPQPVVTPRPVPSNPAAPVGSLTADENYILQQVNKERTKAGLAPLQIDSRLVQTARAKSQDMIAHGYFDHQSPTLGSPFDQMKRAGITYRYAGENIAGNSSAAGAMVSWMNSAGHRANILNPNYTRIGIGIVKGGPYGMMLTQQFIG